MSESKLDRLSRNLERALGLIDLNPHSKTFGCPDRGYWHYSDGKGFVVASPIVSLIGFTGASLLALDKNQVYRFATHAGRHWWSQTILKNRGVDEYFPGQNSFCALAYTTLAIVFSLIHHPDRSHNSTIAIKKAIDSLRNDNHRPESANQSFAASVAFDLATEVLGFELGENPFTPPYDEEDRIFLEYGGFDLAYSLKCVDLCVLALSELRNPAQIKKYQNHLAKLLASLHQFTVRHLFSYELSTRGNPHKLLGGLERLSAAGNACANEILMALNTKPQFDRMVIAETCDDKYLAFFHLTSLYLSAREIPISGLADILPELNGLNSLRTRRFFAESSGERAVTIAWQNGGVGIASSAGVLKIFGNYVLKTKIGLYKVSPTPPPVQMGPSNGDEMILAWDILGEKLEQKSLLVQSFWFSTILKAMMFMPLTGPFLRALIYKKTLNKKANKKMGHIKFNWNKFPNLDVIWQPEVLGAFPVENWSLTDGHSTRLHRHPRIPISAPHEHT